MYRFIYAYITKSSITKQHEVRYYFTKYKIDNRK